MPRGPSSWAVGHPPIPVAMMVIATLAGLFALNTLGVKRNPPIIPPVVQVLVGDSGASAVSVENEITRPIENATSGLPGVRHVSSTVSTGLSQTSIQFDNSLDLRADLDQVKSRIDQIRLTLPRSIDNPVVQRVDPDAAATEIIAAEDTGVQPERLSRLLETEVIPRVTAIKGVYQARLTSGPETSLNVVLDPDRLLQYDVTAVEVGDAVYAVSPERAGGLAEVSGAVAPVRVLSQTGDAATFARMTLPFHNGTLRLGDVATVGIGGGEPIGSTFVNDKSAISFEVSTLPTANDIAAEQQIAAVLKGAESTHPGLKFNVMFSTVDQTKASVLATSRLLVEGMVLTLLVVLVYVRDWRATLAAGIAMPLSLMPTLAVMKVLGYTFNTVTLLALSLVVGILVDDAIVEVENISRKMHLGLSPREAAAQGADEIGLAVSATTLAIVAVFLPVSLVGGVVGEYFRQFGVVVCVAVIFSLVVARFITPLLAALILNRYNRPAKSSQVLADKLGRLVEHKSLMISVTAGVLTLVAFGLLVTNKTGFLPKDDSGYILAQARLPPGLPLPEINQKLRLIASRLAQQSDVDRVYVHRGSPGSGDSSDTAQIVVKLLRNRRLSTQKVSARLESVLTSLPDTFAYVEGGSGAPDFQIVLQSDDAEGLERSVGLLRTQMRDSGLFKDIQADASSEGPEILARPRGDEARRLGISSETLARTIQVATAGDLEANLARVEFGQERLPVRIHLPYAPALSLNQLGLLRVRTGAQSSTPLSALVDFQPVNGFPRLSRYDRLRSVTLLANVEKGHSLAEALRAALALPAIKHLPPTVHLNLAGDSSLLQDTINDFLLALIAGVVLQIIVLAIIFQSLIQPMIIAGSLPLCLLGVTVALRVCSIETTLPVFIGVLMLFGISAKNSVLLLTKARSCYSSGCSAAEAMTAAISERMRPIFMTSLAIIAGMLPTALGLGEGADFRQPMAVAVIGGVVSSTVLSLVVVPAMYLAISRLRRRSQRLPRSEKSNHNLVSYHDHTLSV